MMLLVVIASDTGAYFGGRAFGSHKLAPRVSPHKTIEGAIAGLAASIATGLILRPWLMSQWSIGASALISGIIAILAQAGDLAGSAFKRVAGVKDSGWIFPGHGGLLDAQGCGQAFNCSLEDGLQLDGLIDRIGYLIDQGKFSSLALQLFGLFPFLALCNQGFSYL